MRTFLTQYQVQYADCTVGNHVYYSRYLEILEWCRGEFFRQLGHPLLELQRQDLIFPVTFCSVRYLAPARYDDLLDVSLQVIKAQGARLSFAYQMTRQSAPQEKPARILQADLRHVAAGPNEKPRRLPLPLIEAFKPFLAPPARADAAEPDPETGVP